MNRCGIESGRLRVCQQDVKMKTLRRQIWLNMKSSQKFAGLGRLHLEFGYDLNTKFVETIPISPMVISTPRYD
jgi:predicted transcriptional regulator